METGRVSRAAAAVVKAGLKIMGGFPETLANGFSMEAGIAFKFDAATATDGFTTETASVPPVFTLGLKLCSIPEEETEAAGVTSGVVLSVATPGNCAVFVTTAPSLNVV